MDLNDFKPEETTIWSFKERGSWATHSGDYRGNWSPYVPRNLILRYTNPGDWVLDQFMGSGTTLIEAKLLNRNAVGVDINSQAVKLTEKNLKFARNSDSMIIVRRADAANLSLLKDEGVDFICTHPPYADIIKYSDGIEGDLSLLNVKAFLASMEKVAVEAYRVLKHGKKCAVMMGDIRKKGCVIPLGFRTKEAFS